MIAIFWLSGTPAEPLMQTLDPIIARAPQSVEVPLAKKPIEIEWLKVGHFVGYFLLGAALVYALEPETKHPGWWAIMIVVLYAASDEVHQVFVPGRHAGWTDVVLDTMAAGVSVVGMRGIKDWKRKRNEDSSD
jgi:VanZ family protein